MTILVDDAIWPAHGRRFAHLVSDSSFDELHEFAVRVGLPRRAFHRDHYDLPHELRAAAIALGAKAVTSRDIVRSLQAAGLRRRKRGELRS